VFGSFVEAGLEKDPNFGDNIHKVYGGPMDMYHKTCMHVILNIALMIMNRIPGMYHSALINTLMIPLEMNKIWIELIFKYLL